MQYLKKSKIRKIVVSLGLPVPALKDCSYKFCNGSEWLIFDSIDHEFSCEIYVCKNWLSIEKFYYDEFDSRFLIERQFFDKSKLNELIKLVS